MSQSGFSISTLPYPLTKTNLKIGIAVASWNADITSILKEGAMEELMAQGIHENQIVICDVPGTFELPSVAQWLCNTGCDAVIALGCVIRGETPHFDYVCQGATDGIMQVGLSTNKPCIFGVLTTENHDQAMQRCGGTHGHKGKESAQTALWMLAIKQSFI